MLVRDVFLGCKVKKIKCIALPPLPHIEFAKILNKTLNFTVSIYILRKYHKENKYLPQQGKRID